ncbi:MAG: type II secretion system protein [Kangiellaceae bacterium]|jgi:MSHA pilin protein MshA|nr:type II secretion system protein [Kangiellaceae bacterium]
MKGYSFYNRGFTLIELVVVIALLGILAAFISARAVDLTAAARAKALDGIAGTLRSTAQITIAKAYAKGLVPAQSNPGGSSQTGFLVTFPFGSAEVDWRNLCPESQAELGDNLTMLDFIELQGADLSSRTNNRYTLIGYDIPNGFSVPTNRGCYVIYDSFGNPNCTVTVVTADC